MDVYLVYPDEHNYSYPLCRLTIFWWVSLPTANHILTQPADIDLVFLRCPSTQLYPLLE